MIDNIVSPLGRMLGLHLVMISRARQKRSLSPWCFALLRQPSGRRFGDRSGELNHRCVYVVKVVSGLSHIMMTPPPMTFFKAYLQ